jgi:hypothetical protein
MPLRGEAKRTYQREYMRRRKAEQLADDIECCGFCGIQVDEQHPLVRSKPEAPFMAYICGPCAESADYTVRYMLDERKRYGPTD